MSGTFEKIVKLVLIDDWQASEHALDKLMERGLFASDLADAIGHGVVIEDSPDYHLGPCVLLLQADRVGPAHALWGLAAATTRPAYLIKAYRPDPKKWHDDNRTRRR